MSTLIILVDCLLFILRYKMALLFVCMCVAVWEILLAFYEFFFLVCIFVGVLSAFEV